MSTPPGAPCPLAGDCRRSCPHLTRCAQVAALTVDNAGDDQRRERLLAALTVRRMLPRTWAQAIAQDPGARP